jgi:ParB family chromosome partitioning protein
MTQEEIAAKVGKSRSAIANALRLLRLAPEVQQRIQTGELTAGHARALLAAGTTEEQTELALLVRERGLNVREAEAEARARRRPAAASVPANPALAELEHRLEVRFGTRVRIRARKADGTSGRIEIEYYNAADLERIFDAAGASYLL